MAHANVPAWKNAIWNPDLPNDTEDGKTALRRRFHFGVEIGDDVLECRYSLLNRGDLHQFPAANRTVAVLQADNQISALLFKLNKR